MPAGMTHEEHMEQMKKEVEMKQHGDTAMGFDQSSAEPDHFAHRFDNPSEYIDRFDDPKRDEWQMPERVIDALGLKLGDSVADIGAGTGYFTTRLAKSATKPVVYAVDIEQSMVEHTLGRAKQARLGNVIGVKADADRTNLPAPVDVVLIVDTFHHLPNRVAYFRSLRQQLNPGARVAIIDWRKDSPEGPPLEFRYSPAQISAELRQAGFALSESLDFLPRQHFLIFRAR
jgi:ubiquinone/menaquinone biosynthesis C-methylase UbiE